MSLGEYIKRLRKDKNISQRELAEKSGISNAEISRIETGDRQKPSPDVLRQLAPYLEVAYEELMEKAGYMNDRIHYIEERNESFKEFITMMTPSLLLDGWSVELAKRSQMTGDIIATRNNEEWYIDFKYLRNEKDDNKNFRNRMMIRETAVRIYGRLAMYQSATITKFSLAINNQGVFEELIKYNPIHSNIKVSILLVNLANLAIIKEHYFQ